MKIIKKTYDFENLGDKEIIFEIPSSMRTISIDFDFGDIERYHLSLPAMRFRAVFDLDNYDDVYLSSLAGVFLSGDGEVYPMMLPNIYTDSIICLGLDSPSIKKIVYDKEKLLPDDVIVNNIYSNFIQSYFTDDGEVMDSFFYYQHTENSFFENDSRYKFKRTNYNDFYTKWSSRGRNYDICSDLGVKKHRDVLFGEMNPYWAIGHLNHEDN